VVGGWVWSTRPRTPLWAASLRSKFLPEELAKDRQALERFQRKPGLPPALNHPTSCTIHEIGQQDGQAYIVMELLEGHTLKQHIAGKALDIEKTVGARD